MSYQPFDKKPSGIVFFGTSPSDQVYESDASFVYGDDVLHVPNIKLANAGKIGSEGTANAIEIAADGSVSIAGDLTVNGTQTILNTETLEIEDNILLLNKNVSGAPTLDAGFEVNRGTEANVFVTYDEGDNNWHFTNDGTTYYDMWTSLSVGADNGGNQNILEGQTLSISGGVGITTSTGANSVTVAVDKTVITSQTVANSADSANDFLLIYDADADALKKITKSDFVADLGGGTVSSIDLESSGGSISTSGGPITSAGTIDINIVNGGVDNVHLANSGFTLSGDSGSETVELGDTLQVLGGSGAETSVTSDDTVTVNVKTDNTTIGINASNELEVVGGLDKTVGTPGDGDTIDKDVNLVTAGSGSVTVTLPAPSVGKMVTVKKIDSGAGGVIVSRNTADLIDGAISKMLYHRNESMTVVSDGDDWFII